MMLTSCAQFKKEEDVVLNVAVHDETYGSLIKELWEENYPDQELVVSVVDEEEMEEKIMSQKIDYDVYWIEDAYVPLVIDKLMKLDDDVEVPLNTKFSETFDLIKKVYQPIMATSDTYYALDLNKLEKDQISEDVFFSFESMSELENSFYYLDNIKFTKAFLTSNINYYPAKKLATLSFLDESFAISLQNYRKILELVECNDSSSYDNWFIEDSYYSGFIVDSMQLDADEEVNQGKYKITKLPTIQGEQLYMEAISRGYVVNSECAYPKAASNLIQLMHSKEGMQLLCNQEDWICLIDESMVDEFTFINEHVKEKAYALNYAIGRSFVGVEGRSDAAIDYLYLKSTQEKLRNCNLDEIEVCQAELDEEYQEWLK